MSTTLQCRHCRGPMLKQPVYDLVRQDGLVWFGQWRWIWHCRECGEAVMEPGQESQQGARSPSQRTDTSFQMF